MDPIVLSEPQKADIKFITTLEDESACADPPRVTRTPSQPSNQPPRNHPTFVSPPAADLPPFLPPTVRTAVIQEFAHVSLGLLTKGADAGVKTFAGAAKKLAVPVDAVRDGCRSLCHLLSQFARHGARPGPELADRLAAVGFRESSRDALASVYAHHAAELRALVTSAPAVRGVATFADLSWRLDARTASRALTDGKDAEAAFLVELRLKSPVPSPSDGPGDGPGDGRGGAGTRGVGSGAEETTTLVELDVETMRELRDEMEAALAATDSATARRIKKYVRRKMT